MRCVGHPGCTRQVRKPARPSLARRPCGGHHHLACTTCLSPVASLRSTIGARHRLRYRSLINRGLTLTSAAAAQLPDRSRLHIGVGRVTAGRVGLFRQQRGLAVELQPEGRVYDLPSLQGAAPRVDLGDALWTLNTQQAGSPAPP